MARAYTFEGGVIIALRGSLPGLVEKNANPIVMYICIPNPNLVIITIKNMTHSKP